MARGIEDTGRVYRRLAARLDRFPQGFPSTPDGLELRILQRIFTPEDAALALRLRARPETPHAVARRAGRADEDVADALASMAARGQVLALPSRRGPRYMLVPFVVGIYEFQLPRMDAELAALCEAYLPVLMRTMGRVGPALGRVVPALGRVVPASGQAIPVGARFDARADVLPYEDLARMIDEARSFRVMDCLCRTERAALGHPCTHPLETCLALSSREDAFREYPPWGRTITREEARAVLDLAEREGLVHCTYNVQRESMFVCNCCACCCGFLRGVVEFEAPHLLLRSSRVAAVDAEACVACGAAAAERCPTRALAAAGQTRASEPWGRGSAPPDAAPPGGCHVDETRCIGCGVCAVACPSDALALVARPGDDVVPPPRDMARWVFQREFARSGPLRGIGRLARLLLT